MYLRNQLQKLAAALTTQQDHAESRPTPKRRTILFLPDDQERPTAHNQVLQLRSTQIRAGDRRGQNCAAKREAATRPRAAEKGAESAAEVLVRASEFDPPATSIRPHQPTQREPRPQTIQVAQNDSTGPSLRGTPFPTTHKKVAFDELAPRVEFENPANSGGLSFRTQYDKPPWVTKTHGGLYV
ncbi:MAG: hypothetical protein Fues2KO_12670 [Fuerstiella sp.]